MLEHDPDAGMRDDRGDSLLDAGGLTDLLRGPAAGERSPIEDGPSLVAGTRLGDVTIVRLIASGGMGRVYEGLQGMPCRTVAVKVVRPGMVSASALRRFEAEAQTLGRLTHPAIARIYSMGVETVGDTTVPYFVMEYVEDAKTLTAYAAEKELSSRDRFGLFREVCRAVAHGHAKGVIHRDLKPANILVDGHGQVKVIDFGVARSTDADLSRTTMHTDMGQLIGTLCYMAPEQFQGQADEIDVRADVYALGVVLYELLAGVLPYDLLGRPVYEVARIVHEVDARRLSAVMPSLRGDPATIVGKCLEKPRERRYAHAGDLEADVGRFLRGEPITARPPNLAESLARLARRHRLAAVAAAGVVAAFAVAFVGISLFALRAERARETAQREQARADAEAETSRQRLFVANLRSLRACLDSRNVRLARELFADNQSLLAGPATLEMRVLGATLDDALQVIAPARGSVAGLTYSPDGGMLAAACAKSATKREGATRQVNPMAVFDVHVLAPDFVCYATDRVPYRPLERGRPHERDRPVEQPSDQWLHAWMHRGGRPAGLASRVTRTSQRLAATADGKLVVEQRRNGRACVVEAASGEVVAELADHEGRVMAATIAPLGRRVAMQGIDGGVRLWDAETGRCLGRCGRSDETVDTFLFNPDGTRLATVGLGSGSREDVHLFDTAEARHLGTATRKKSRSTSRSLLAFSPDGDHLAATAPDGRVVVWAGADAAELIMIQDHATDITALAWTPDGTRLVSGGLNGHLHVRDAGTGRLVRRLLAHDSAVLAIAFHPDGDTLASGSHDGTIRTWLLESPLPLAALPGASGLAAAAFSPDSRHIAVAPRDGRDIEIWEVPAMRRVRVVEDAGGSAARLAFSPDGGFLAATICDREGDVAVWDVASGERVALLAAGQRPIGSLAFSADGQRLLVSFPGGEMSVWNLATRSRTARVAAGPTGVVDDPGAVFIRDGALVVGQRPELIHSDTGEFAMKLPPRGKVTSLAVNHASTVLASGAAIGAVHLNDLATGNAIAFLNGHSDRVGVLTFSHDGKVLASGSVDGTVRLWDGRSGAPVEILRGHEGPVERVAFTPDDRRIVSAATDGTIRIWEAASGHELCSLPSSPDAAHAMALSPDGRLLVAATPEGQVRVWGLSNADIAAARTVSGPR